jgi:t-SNARE complex subunit (syntaxin)
MTEPPRHPETGDDDSGSRYDRESRTGIPRWVMVVGIIVIIVVLLVVVLMLTGVFSDGHRPGPPPGGH